MPSRTLSTSRRDRAWTVGLVLFSLILLAGCGVSSGGSPAISQPTASGPQATVHITGSANSAYQFSPASITVTVGTTVAWINGADVAHTTTSDPGSALTWDSGAIPPSGGIYTFTFTKVGTFPYQFPINAPTMRICMAPSS